MEEKKLKEEQSTKATSRFLLGILVFGSAVLVFKLAWNLGLASLFSNKIPHIGFIHSFTWLTMLYIVSRVVSAGFMSEVERTVDMLFEGFSNAVKDLQSFVKSAKAQNEQTENYSDLN